MKNAWLAPASSGSPTPWNDISNKRPASADLNHYGDDIRAWGGDVSAEGHLLNNLGVEAWNSPTLVNSWDIYDAAQSDPGYFKDVCGIVHLRGVFKAGTNNATIFTLPSGYRPPKFGCFAGFCTDGGGTYKTCLIGVSGSGAVIAYGVGSGFNFQVSVDGISFRTT